MNKKEIMIKVLETQDKLVEKGHDPDLVYKKETTMKITESIVGKLNESRIGGQIVGSALNVGVAAVFFNKCRKTCDDKWILKTFFLGAILPVIFTRRVKNLCIRSCKVKRYKKEGKLGKVAKYTKKFKDTQEKLKSSAKAYKVAGKNDKAVAIMRALKAYTI